MNLRPLGPEATPGDLPRVLPGSTASSRVDVSRGCETGGGTPASTDSTETKRRGAPVVRNLRPVSEVLTVAEVARELRVCRATVYALAERGELEHFRVGNSIRVHRATLEALVGRGAR